MTINIRSFGDEDVITDEELATGFQGALSSVLGLSDHVIAELKFDGKYPQQLCVVCLYARLHELACGAMALLETGALVGIPLLLRAMFECDVDLTNAVKDPLYYKNMHSSYLKEQIRLGSVAESTEDNPYFGSADARPDILARLHSLRKELSVLKSEDRGPLQIHERALLAGRQQEYRTVYNMLCGDTHNSTESLESWHIDKSSPDLLRVTLFKMRKNEILHYLSSLPGLLLIQAEVVAQFFGTEGIDFDAYFHQVTGLHSEFKGKAHEMREARLAKSRDRGKRETGASSLAGLV